MSDTILDPENTKSNKYFWRTNKVMAGHMS